MRKRKWIILIAVFVVMEILVYRYGSLLLSVFDSGILAGRNLIVRSDYDGWHPVQPWSDEPATVKLPVQWVINDRGKYKEILNEDGSLIGFLGKESDCTSQEVLESYYRCKIANQSWESFEMNNYQQTWAFASYCHTILVNDEWTEQICISLKLNQNREMWWIYLLEQDGGLPTAEAEAIAFSLSVS